MVWPCRPGLHLALEGRLGDASRRLPATGDWRSWIVIVKLTRTACGRAWTRQPGREARLRCRWRSRHTPRCGAGQCTRARRPSPTRSRRRGQAVESRLPGPQSAATKLGVKHAKIWRRLDPWRGVGWGVPRAFGLCRQVLVQLLCFRLGVVFDSVQRRQVLDHSCTGMYHGSWQAERKRLEQARSRLTFKTLERHMLHANQVTDWQTVTQMVQHKTRSLGKP